MRARNCKSSRAVAYALRSFSILLLGAASVLAAKKVISPTTTASNDQLDLQMTITLAEDEVAQKLGVDPGKGIVLLQVRVTPKTDKPVDISPDDFILLAHDDGERAKPFEPSEIAGQGAMVISNSADAKKDKKSGGMIGFGGIMGGGGGSPGNSKPVDLNSKMETKSGGNSKLLEALKAKALPATQSIEPVEGFLYFPLDGKHKLKNLAVLYRGPAGKLDLEFQH
jgi:hypothetical protein